MTQSTGEGSSAPRLDSLQRMLAARPDDTRALFGLAVEYERLGRWDEAVASLQRYLQLAADEGNAYGRLGHALRQLGRIDEAVEAYRRGAEVALRHGHPTMAEEFEEVVEELRG